MKFPLLSATALVATLSLVPLSTGAMAAVDASAYREMERFMDVYNRVKAD